MVTNYTNYDEWKYPYLDKYEAETKAVIKAMDKAEVQDVGKELSAWDDFYGHMLAPVDLVATAPRVAAFEKNEKDIAENFSVYPKPHAFIEHEMSYTAATTKTMLRQWHLWHLDQIRQEPTATGQGLYDSEDYPTSIDVSPQDSADHEQFEQSKKKFKLKADRPRSPRAGRPRYPAYKKNDRVTTPNGSGNVWSVDGDGTVCVELDNEPTVLHEFEKKEIKKAK